MADEDDHKKTKREEKEKKREEKEKKREDKEKQSDLENQETSKIKKFFWRRTGEIDRLFEKFRSSEKRFSGYYTTLLWNFVTFLIPAFYITLNKLWIARVDPKQVATSEAYTYILALINIVNDSFPRAVWNLIGDKYNRTLTSRLNLSYTLICVQMVAGGILTIALGLASKSLAKMLVPDDVRATSITYVRISALHAFSSALEMGVSFSSRALDHPDIPLVVSCVKFFALLIIEGSILSKRRVGQDAAAPINSQAAIKEICDLFAAAFGLVWFMQVAKKMIPRKSNLTRKATSSDDLDIAANPAPPKESNSNEATAPEESDSSKNKKGPKCWPSYDSFKILIEVAKWPFLESALRNLILIWVTHGIVQMDLDEATASTVFDTIRWGIIMVPVQALEATTLTFVSHNWGEWRKNRDPLVNKPKATDEEIHDITKQVGISFAWAASWEVSICAFFSVWGARKFAFYLSGSGTVANLAQNIWRTTEWSYVLNAFTRLTSAIFIATVPRYFLYPTIATNLFWMIPWALAAPRIHLTSQNSWTYQGVIFAGERTFELVCVGGLYFVWAWRLKKGKTQLASLPDEVILPVGSKDSSGDQNSNEANTPSEFQTSNWT